MTLPARLARAREERGMTLIELTVAVGLFGAVVAIVGPLMTSALDAGREVTNESRALDEIRVSIARIDRELRSACEVTTPGIDQTGSSLTFKTKANSAQAYEVTYEVNSDGELTRTTTDETEVIGEGLVVTTEEFTHTLDNTGTRARVGIRLEVRYEESNDPRVIATTIAGRNTWEACT